ncbi:MAG TPA: hypothetical protein VNQ52_10005 [Microbacteriaceae bacterium]|nr:hypothetical protein [Microbacteriaceae bacterium]
MIGYWRALGRSWPTTVPTVIGLAAAHAGLTALTAAWPPGLGLTAPLSFLAIAGGAMLLAAGAAAAAQAVRRPRFGIALIVTAILAVLIVSAAGLPGQAWSLIALPPAAIALTAAAAAPAFSRPFAAFRAHPVAASVAVIVTVLAGGIVWTAALLLGFFLTGPRASGLTWFLAGIAATMVLVWWSVLRTPRGR